jgi:hypothetical protein
LAADRALRASSSAAAVVLVLASGSRRAFPCEPASSSRACSDEARIPSSSALRGREVLLRRGQVLSDGLQVPTHRLGLAGRGVDPFLGRRERLRGRRQLAVRRLEPLLRLGVFGPGQLELVPRGLQIRASGVQLCLQRVVPPWRR